MLDKTHGREPWISSGEVGSYQLIKDICPGQCSSSTSSMIVFNDLLFFDADDGVHESELWVSDGTGAGTLLFANIYDDTSSPAVGDYVTGMWAFGFCCPRFEAFIYSE